MKNKKQQTNCNYAMAVILVIALAVPAMLSAAGTVYTVGASPQNYAQPCSLYTPSLVSLTITDTVRIILSSANVGDSVWPKYFHPTTPSTAPYCAINYWTNDSTGAKIATKGSANFSSSITLGQLFWAHQGEALTTNGASPGANWTAFTTSDVTVDSTGGAQSKTHNLDYEFQWEHTDAAFSGPKVNLTYTVTANPN